MTFFNDMEEELFQERYNKMSTEEKLAYMNSLKPVYLDQDYGVHPMNMIWCEDCEAFHPEDEEVVDALVVLSQNQLERLHRSLSAYLKGQEDPTVDARYLSLARAASQSVN